MSVLAAFARSPYFSTVFTRKNVVFILTATAAACEIKRKANGQNYMNYKARRLQKLAGLIFALI